LYPIYKLSKYILSTSNNVTELFINLIDLIIQLKRT